MSVSTSYFAGYAVPPGSYAAAAPRRTSRGRLALTWFVAIGLLAAALVGVSVMVSEPPVRYVCPPDCGRPPTGTPVAINPRFTAPDGAFSVSYPAPGSAYRVSMKPDGVTAELLAGDGGTLQLFSEPAVGRSPGEIAKTLVATAFPDAQTAYEIPNAMVGYHSGYGEVFDFWPQGANGSYLRMRVLVMAAVKNDLALVAAAMGPYHEFGPDFGFGKPSGANVQIALDMGKYVNSFSWRGDPPR